MDTVYSDDLRWKGGVMNQHDEVLAIMYGSLIGVAVIASFAVVFFVATMI